MNINHEPVANRLMIDIKHQLNTILVDFCIPVLLNGAILVLCYYFSYYSQK